MILVLTLLALATLAPTVAETDRVSTAAEPPRTVVWALGDGADGSAAD